MARVCILLVSAAPDSRPSTASLRHLADVMSARSDVDPVVWFLRSAWDQSPWPNSFVVDSLRTWPPAAALSAVGLSRAAGGLRGARLKWMLRRRQPDLVLLDDGLGGRLLDAIPRSSPVVVRRNRTEPADAALETPFEGSPAAVVARTDGDPGDGGSTPVLIEYDTRDDWKAARRAGSEVVRRSSRDRLGLPPTGTPLVVGWGDSGWIDGPDVFIRALWALENSHGVQAHGAWFGSVHDPHERDRLQAEARRCGVLDRFHHLPLEGLDSWSCGDAVFLPWRDAGDSEQILQVICSGAAVVAFTGNGVDDPAVRTVDHLDVAGAADALQAILQEDRDQRWADTLRRLDTQSLVDELVALATTGGSAPDSPGTP